MKFSAVSKLVINCGKKPQCLRNPNFVRFSQKYPVTQTTPKKPDLVGKPNNVKPMANKGLLSISQEVIELES